MSEDIAALIAFISARLDEDEELSRDLLRGHPGPWSLDDSFVLDAAGNTVIHDEFRWDALPYIARHDPARALREAEAGRRLLAELEKGIAAAIAAPDNPAVRAAVEALLWSASDRAAAWSGHPDYRPEWKP